MKKVFIFLSITAALALAACAGSKNNGARQVMRASSGNPAPGYVSAAAAGQSSAQFVQLTGFTQQTATDYVNGAVSLGNVTGCANCGIYFNVSQNPNANNFSPLAVSMSGSGYIVSGSPGILTVLIYDSNAATQGGPIWAAPGFSQGQMNYSGSGGNVTLLFSDGSQISGQIQGSLLQGALSFSGVNGQESLGQFSTNVCYILSCSN